MTTRELFEYDARFEGVLAGVDEAGRGPLAGPVVCACCVMGDCFIDGINDSKKLSEKKRELLYEEIVKSAVCYGVGIVDEKTIDNINILKATKLCMENAINSISTMPDTVLIDAVTGLAIPYKQRPIIKGDATSYAIAAASIIAKVTRDRIMRDYAVKYPEYGFDKHKGYGTREHIAALLKYGPCDIHRRTFIGNFVGHEQAI